MKSKAQFINKENIIWLLFKYVHTNAHAQRFKTKIRKV